MTRSSVVAIHLILQLLVILGSCQNSSAHLGTSVDPNDFTFYSAPDPTHGFVHYVGKTEAARLGLIHRGADGVLVIRADNRTISPNGRPSVRLESKKVYNGGLFVFDIEHIPEGCGTWPALWLLGPDWPNGGEIDIVEGVNMQKRNRMSLHTGPGCAMPSMPSRHQKGKLFSKECDGNRNGNVGCYIEDSSLGSYGPQFNSHGGGIFVVQWKPDKTIMIWFFDRKDEHNQRKHWQQQAPAFSQSFWEKQLLEERPSAVFDLKSCPKHAFRDMRLIINLTFCGDWAGQSSGVYNARCPRDCQAHVRNTPSAFTEAYWRFRSIQIFSPTKP